MLPQVVCIPASVSTTPMAMEAMDMVMVMVMDIPMPPAMQALTRYLIYHKLFIINIFNNQFSHQLKNLLNQK